jgi:hypothetical protein
MADFGFVGASYEAPSLYQDSQECINWFPEVDPTKAQGSRGVVSLYPTPGLTSVAALSAQAEVRGMRTLSGGQYMVAVCGGYVYLINNTFEPIIIGQLNTETGYIGITDNGINVYIVDGSYRYTWRISEPSTASFKGTISGTTLTVSSYISGTIGVNQALFGLNIPSGTVIVSGSGTTWTLNNSASVSSTEVMYSANIAGYMTASISGTTLTVSTINPGATIYPGQTIVGAGVLGNTIVTALGSGTVLSATISSAGTGYAVNDTITVLGGVYGNSPATFTVTAVGSGGSVTSITQTYSGQYTSFPLNPASTSTNNAGTGLTLTLTTGTGTGQTGSYVINNSQTVGSETMYILNWSVLPDTDGAFQGATVVDIVDNYFVYNDPNTQKWAASNLLSPITYGLSFASKFTGPDNLVSLICDHGQVYLLGEQTSEVWADTGTFPFAFQRIPGSSSQHGIVSAFSVAKLGNSFAYLARNNRGQAEIVQMNGYFPQRISTHAVENTLVDQYVGDAVAYTYQLEGHEVYVISFPTIDLTWAFDFTTQLWHKWLWVDNNNVYHRHRSNCAAFFQGLVLVGDWENGLIYQLDPNNYTDNGSKIRRLRRAPHLVTDLQRQYFAEMQIQFQPGVGLSGTSVPAATPQSTGTTAVQNYVNTLSAIYQVSPYTISPGSSQLIAAGDSFIIYPPTPGTTTYVQSPYIINAGNSYTIAPNNTLVVQASTVITPLDNTDPQAMLRWSNDGGSTWSNEHWTGIGRIGKYKNRAIWRRLGWSRDRVFEVVVTDPVKAVIVSANLKAEEGEN